MFLWIFFGIIAYISIILLIVASTIAYATRCIEREPDTDKSREVKSIIRSMESDLGYPVRLSDSIPLALIKNLNLCFACVIGFTLIILLIMAVAMLIMILTLLF